MHHPICTFTVFLICTAVVSATSIPISHIVHERRHAISNHWIKKTRAPSSAFLPVRIALTQQNLRLGHDLLMAIADPDSPTYGQHYSSNQVFDLFAPALDTVTTVREWLVDSGIDESRHRYNGYYIDFHSTVEELEVLLATKYHVFHHEFADLKQYACDEYSVPRTVQHHINFISPTVGHSAQPDLRFSKRGATKARSVGALRPVLQPASGSVLLTAGASDSLANCDVSVTPACIRALYNIPLGTTNTSLNQLGIYEDGDYYDKVDLDLYHGKFTNIPIGVYPELKSIDGGLAPIPVAVQRGIESVLDFSLASSLIYPRGTILFQTNDKYSVESGFMDIFLDALDASFCTYKGGDSSMDPTYPDPNPKGYQGKLQCGVYKPTNVISISYGLDEQSLPALYMQRQCYEYMKLGLQGTTTVVASGDNGVQSAVGCIPLPGQGFRKARKYGAFAPVFPAVCPYVLAVGATQIANGHTVHDPEVAAHNASFHFASGSGFSNQNSMPAYQYSAVTAYLRSNPPPFSLAKFNATGRAYPDVAAIGNRIALYLQGKPQLASGTSASAPIWASVITLLNEARLQAGKAPVGFVNPVLYKNPAAMRDVTRGSSPGCNTTGFTAAEGWDPVSGLGTPDFKALKAVFMALP